MGRRALLAVLDQCIERAKKKQGELAAGQENFFSADQITPIEIPNTPDDEDENLNWEKELLGMYVSGHPMDHDRELYQHCFYPSQEIVMSNRVLRPGQTVIVAGVIGAMAGKEAKKSKRRWAIVTLDDPWGQIDVLFFPDTYDQFREILTPFSKIAVIGRTMVDSFSRGGSSEDDAETLNLVDETAPYKLSCQAAMTLDEYKSSYWQPLDTRRRYTLEEVI